MEEWKALVAVAFIIFIYAVINFIVLFKFISKAHKKLLEEDKNNDIY